MPTDLHVQTTVLPGHRIQITAPQFAEGEVVEVIVRPGTATPRRSMLELLQALPPGPLLFPTPEDADRYLREERDAWER